MFNVDKKKSVNTISSHSGKRKTGKTHPGILPVVLVAFAVGIICALIVVVVQVVRTSPAFALKSINVQGPASIDRQLIIDKSGLVVGMRMTAINTDSIAKKLSAINRIKNITVNMRIPDAVQIRYAERIALASIMHKGVVGIDADGVLIPLSQQAFARVPLVSGYTVYVDSMGIARIDSVTNGRLASFLRDIVVNDKSMLQRIAQINFAKAGAVTCVFADSRRCVTFQEQSIVPALKHLRRLEIILAEASDTLLQRINLYNANMAYVN